MTLDSYGVVWEADPCYPLSKTHLCNDINIIKAINWINLRPMYRNENSSKGSKIIHHLFLLQQI